MCYLKSLLFVVQISLVAIAQTNSDYRVTAGDEKDVVRDVVSEMQGKWVCVWDQRNGRPDKGQIGTLFVFQGTKMTHWLLDGRHSRWEFRLAETHSHGIDWRNLAGRNSFEPGVFHLHGDTLVFCDGFPIDKRPEHFSDGSHLNVLRRIASNHSRVKPVALKEKLVLQTNKWVDAQEFVVPAKRNRDNPVSTNIHLQEGEVFIVQPNEEARWGAHGPDGPQTDYAGLGRTDSLLALFFRVDKAVAPVVAGRPMTVISPGELEFYCQDNEPSNNIGEVNLKVIRLRTNK